MKRLSAFLTLIVVLAVHGGAASFGSTELQGEKHGACFRIVVPDEWNGDLVIWGHGFRFSPIAELCETDDQGNLTLDLGPLRDIQLTEGYAVAASSYSQIGWAVFQTTKDYKTLIQAFKENFGEPNQILLYGASLGGLVTARAVETIEPDVGRITGALSFCGALAGSRVWDGLVDLRLIYDAVCDDVPGASIPGGAAGLPEGSPFDELAVTLAVNACTGALLPPVLRTPGQSERLARIIAATQIPNEGFLLGDMPFATLGLSDLVHDPEKLKGRIGAGNIGVTYADEDINATIERAAPHPGGQNRVRKNYTPSGEVGDVKIISLHTDKDGLVIVENETEYANVVPPTNLTTAIVVEDEPTHCGFTPAEVIAGWESLRAWVASAAQPTAANIQGLCQFLALGGGGPCRIDPAFVLGNFDDRVPPR